MGKTFCYASGMSFLFFSHGTWFHTTRRGGSRPSHRWDSGKPFTVNLVRILINNSILRWHFWVPRQIFVFLEEPAILIPVHINAVTSFYSILCVPPGRSNRISSC